MQFTLKSKDLFSHLVLNNTDYTKRIAETPEWKNDGILTAELRINGLEVPAESLDRLLKDMWEQCQIDSGKEAFQRKVEGEAKRILKDMNAGIYNMMADLTNKLETYEDELKYPWEMPK